MTVLGGMETLPIDTDSIPAGTSCPQPTKAASAQASFHFYRIRTQFTCGTRLVLQEGNLGLSLLLLPRFA